MKTRTIVMTIYKIESDLLNVTTPGDRGERWLPGFIRVAAQGDGEFHEWQLQPSQRCWIGDRVEVVVVEDDPEPQESTELTPPAIDKRGRAA